MIIHCWPDPRPSCFEERVMLLADRITYRKGYRLRLRKDSGFTGRWYLQVEVDRPDATTGILGAGRGGKAYLSPHMVDGEIARLIFGLLLAYEEHEVREFFRIDGVAVFGPHISLDALLAAGTQLEARP